MLSLGNKLTLNSAKPIYHFVNKYSIDFDGSDQCIVTDGADTVAQPTTYSFWCKSSTTAQNKGVFGHGADREGGFHFNDGDKPLLLLGPSCFRYWNDTSAQDDGEWHHWVVYSDPNDITNSKLYVDSVLQTVSSTTSSGSANAYTESLTIGGTEAAGGDYFEGKIDEFAVYDRELTQDEITRMYNTYYSPNRVANGNFSQIGNEEVTNGDFSQEGSEEVTNGNFATDSDWIKGTGWSIANGKASITESGAVTLAQTLTTPLTSGKIYKVIYTVSNYVGSGIIKVQFAGDGTLSGQNITANGTYVEYLTTTGNYTIVRLKALGNNGGFTGSIDNVSVKEVGQDWTLSDVVNITENGLSVNPSSFVFFATRYAIENGKNYKVTLDSVVTSGDLLLYTGTQFATIDSTNSYTFYTTSDSSQIRFRSGGSGFTGSINNISVKEVGQGWTLGDAFTVSNNELVCDGSQTANSFVTQTVGFIAGRTYRLNYKVSNLTAGQVRINMALRNGTWVSANGDYTFDMVAIAGTLFQIQANNDLAATLDNIVVQELKHDATNLMLNAGAYQSANPLITSTKSMEFDGSDNFLKVEDSANLRGMAALTVCCWVKFDSKNDYAKVLDYSSTSGNSQRKYRIQLNNATDQKIQFLIANTSDTTSTITSTDAIPTDRWVHLVGTFDNSLSANRQSFYIDGVLENTATAFTETINNDDSGFLSFGENTYGSNNFDGKITEAGVYDRALTSLEVASLYNQGMPTNLLVNRNNYQSGNPTVFNTKQVDFDGTDGHLKVTNAYGSFTGSISGWIILDSYGSDRFLLDARTNSGTGYVLLNLSTPSILTASSGTRYVNGVAGNEITTGVWNHIVVTGISLDITESILIGF